MPHNCTFSCSRRCRENYHFLLHISCLFIVILICAAQHAHTCRNLVREKPLLCAKLPSCHNLVREMPFSCAKVTLLPQRGAGNAPFVRQSCLVSATWCGKSPFRAPKFLGMERLRCMASAAATKIIIWFVRIADIFYFCAREKFWVAVSHFRCGNGEGSRNLSGRKYSLTKNIEIK